MRRYEHGRLMSIICNMCSDVIDELWNDEHGVEQERFKEIRLRYGYGSRLYDLNELSFDLCEQCVQQIVHSFNISPKIENYDWLDGSLETEYFTKESWEKLKSNMKKDIKKMEGESNEM